LGPDVLLDLFGLVGTVLQERRGVYHCLNELALRKCVSLLIDVAVVGVRRDSVVL
jgi:hypothetical protein